MHPLNCALPVRVTRGDINQTINKFYFANVSIETGTWVTKLLNTWLKINHLTLKEPLEIQVVAHRLTFTPPCCRTSPYRMTFISFSVSQWNDLADPVFDGVGPAGFKSRASLSLAWAALALFVFYYVSLSLLCVYRLVLWGWCLWTDRV